MSLPNFAILDGHKPPVRVLTYDGNNFFTVLRQPGDEKVLVKRERLTFVKERKGK